MNKVIIIHFVLCASAYCSHLCPVLRLYKMCIHVYSYLYLAMGSLYVYIILSKRNSSLRIKLKSTIYKLKILLYPKNNVVLMFTF